MDWRIALTTFGTVFLAELGDKTQLATLAMASGGRSRLPVFLGSASALVATSAIAVIAGEAVSRAVPPHVLRRGAGIALVVMGAWMLWASRTARG